MDFRNGQELLELCRKENAPISTVMKLREVTETSLTMEEVDAKMERVLSIMKTAVKTSIEQPKKSISGLIGGEAKKITSLHQNGKSAGGSLMNKIIAYSMAVLEVNASMGVIVAAPTAGSSGVLPGTVLALQDEYDWDDETIYKGLFNASAMGYLLMRNASVAGAEAGCQAEVGAASAMAASAVVEMMGGTPEMCLQAAGMALANLLGLVCDPVAGLVEVPCQTRNATGALNAISCAEIVLSGVDFLVPFDEMAEAMLRVGKGIPFELRETAIGGCAGTPAGCSVKCGICQ